MDEQNINRFLYLIKEIPSLKFDGTRYIIDGSYKSKFEELRVDFDEFGDKLHLKTKAIFSGENVKYFEALESEVKSSDIANSILLISSVGLAIKYNPADSSFVEYGNKNDVTLRKFRNIISYFKLFNFLKEKSFCDYFNDADNEIVFYSSVNGIIKVKYDSIPVVSEKDDITKKITELISLATPIQVSSFFKNSLYTISKGTGTIRISEIINQSEDVIAITKRDYELVSKQFDFEKFKDSLYKEKEKYFTSIREIISKIFSQAVGVPISISASVFATYKVSDDIFMLLLVLLAFGLYVAFYIKIQCTYKADLLEVERDFSSSFDIISTKSGLSNDVIGKEKQKIVNKISSTKTIITWLITIVCALGILVIGYIVYEIIYSESFSLIKGLLKK